MAKPEGEVKDAPKEPFFGKRFWISFAISLPAFLAIVAIYVLVGYYAENSFPEGYNVYLHLFLDGFFASGVIAVCVFALTYVSSKGAFDFLYYSIRYTFSVHFRRDFAKNAFMKSYYDYKALKDSQDRKPVYAILFAGIILLITAIGLFIPYEMMY